MAINYSRVNWDTTKFVNPTNMNQMDQGIKDACDTIDKFGSSIISDLNTTLSNGLYHTTTSTANSPISAEGNVMVMGSGGAIHQILFIENDTIYVRRRSNGSWNSWMQFTNNNRFAVLSGTTSATEGGSVYTTLPSGFTTDNTVIIGLQYYDSGLWRSYTVTPSAPAPITAYIMQGRVYVTTRNGVYGNSAYKVAVMRF